MNYYKRAKFIKAFKEWIVNRDSVEKPELTELIRYYETHNGRDILELDEFVNTANREVIMLNGEGFWNKNNKEE